MAEYFKFENFIFCAGKFVKLYPIMKELIGKSENKELKTSVKFKLCIMEFLSISSNFYYFFTKIIPMNKNGNIVVKNVVLRQEIIDTKFACNLERCKGACCTLESDYGAPLLEEEISQIQDSLAVVTDYLSEIHLNKLAKDGFWERKNGELMVSSVNRKNCVFSFIENGIAKCAFEKAFLEGKTDFRKPISCHLFPIRVVKFGGDVLRYEEFSECAPALEKGKKENISLIDFCKTALIRLYDNNWYSKIKEIIGS